MQLWRFTSAKYQLKVGHDFMATPILVGWEYPNPGVLARGRPFEIARQPLTTRPKGSLM